MDNPPLHFLLELLFPSFCLGCKTEGDLLCYDCQHLLDISPYTYCLCQKPLRFPPGHRQGKCTSCSKKALSGLYFAVPFGEKPLTKHLIYALKEKPYLKSLAPAFARIITEHLVKAQNNTESVWQKSVLVPVPLDTRKIKARNYNHSAEIAKELGKITNTPVLTNALVKVRETMPQKQLSGSEREKNVLGAFSVRNPASIEGKKVFLVDDVYTTGATMAECANVLRTFGAKQVWGIAFAREV